MLEDTRSAIRCMVLAQIEQADLFGRAHYGNSRIVTKEQEMAYRLCHHDFFGLSNGDAAEIMGVTPHAVDCLLNRLRAVAPQLFPVLRPFTARVYTMFVRSGFTIYEIAEELGAMPSSIRTTLWRLWRHRHENDLYFPSGSARRLSYRDWMESHTVTQW